MSNVEKTLITVATYNEMENIPRLAEEIFHNVPEVDILVVDDASPDGTGQWCDRKAAEDPRVRCCHRPGKQGLGGAIVAGMKYAIDHGYRYVLNMDADFSHPPHYLPDLIGGMDPPGGQPVDVMIGSRYIPGGGIEGWPWKRHLMSRGVNFYARWLLGLSPKDCSGGFRCYRTSLLRGWISTPSAAAAIRFRRKSSGGWRGWGRGSARVRSFLFNRRRGPVEDRLPRGDRRDADYPGVGRRKLLSPLQSEPLNHERSRPPQPGLVEEKPSMRLPFLNGAAAASGAAAVSPLLLDSARQDKEGLLATLGTLASGLSEEEAVARLHDVGPNNVAQERQQHWTLRLLLTFVCDPLSLLLTALAIISYRLAEDPADRAAQSSSARSSS